MSRQTVTLVQEKLKNTPLALDLIQPMKPWMVMLMIEALGSQDAGLDPELGLDKHFYNLATDGRKQVIGLETAESQIDRFDKMPEAMQEQMLRSELAEMDTEKSSLRSILTAWQTGDAAAIEKMLLASFTTNPAAYTSLITERNRRIAPLLRAVEGAAAAEPGAREMLDTWKARLIDVATKFAHAAAETEQLAIPEEECRDITYAIVDPRIKVA